MSHDPSVPQGRTFRLSEGAWWKFSSSVLENLFDCLVAEVLRRPYVVREAPDPVKVAEIKDRVTKRIEELRRTYGVQKPSAESSTNEPSHHAPNGDSTSSGLSFVEGVDNC